MEEFIMPAIRVLGYILYFCIEVTFYQVFYYLGSLPVWILSFGRYPSVAPHNLSKDNKIIYSIIGVALTVLIGYIYAVSSV
mgnify:CR=1 FL=1